MVERSLPKFSLLKVRHLESSI